jgi:hypothetical protein
MMIRWPEVVAFGLLLAFLIAVVAELRSWAQAALRLLAVGIASALSRRAARQ